MSDPGVLSRIEQELARTRTVLSQDVPLSETADTRRVRTRPHWLHGEAVERIVAANLLRTAEQLQRMTPDEITTGPCSRFDRAMQPWARRILGNDA